MKHKFKLVKNSNGKLKIQKRNCLSIYKTLVGADYFNNSQECVDYIYKYYNKNECEIKYDKEW